MITSERLDQQLISAKKLDKKRLNPKDQCYSVECSQKLQ